MALSLDLCLAYVPKTISEFLREVSVIRDGSEKIVKLDDYVSRLEEEMRKIDAFKRELPLCMLLLNDAIGRLKEEAMQCTDLRDRPVIEEFVPLKVNYGEDGGEKRNWMSSVQLWGLTESKLGGSEKQGSVAELNLRSQKENRSATEKPVRACSHGSRGGGGGGAFVPFKAATVREEKEVSQISGLCLATPTPEMGPSKSSGGGGGGGRAGSGSPPVFSDKLKSLSKPQPQTHQQSQQSLRKQRRCWSPELHRRFVDALQRLGGSKVATPKQIRELMQVDGLTNDEVKSHLQKYRLHIRKLPASLTSPENASSWGSKDQCGEHSEEPNNSQSGSPQGPLFTGMSAKGISSNGDESMEAEEDEKSECHSWKGGLHHNHKPGEVAVV